VSDKSERSKLKKRKEKKTDPLEDTLENPRHHLGQNNEIIEKTGSTQSMFQNGRGGENPLAGHGEGFSVGDSTVIMRGDVGQGVGKWFARDDGEPNWALFVEFYQRGLFGGERGMTGRVGHLRAETNVSW